jgi:hypothetical protein
VITESPFRPHVDWFVRLSVARKVFCFPTLQRPFWLKKRTAGIENKKLRKAFVSIYEPQINQKAPHDRIIVGWRISRSADNGR